MEQFLGTKQILEFNSLIGTSSYTKSQHDSLEINIMFT